MPRMSRAGVSRLGIANADVAVSTIGFLRDPVGMPAGGPMIRALFLIGRKLATASVVRQSTPRRERARRRQIAERRYDTRDLLQALRCRPGLSSHESEPRNRVHQTTRIGVQWSRE